MTAPTVLALILALLVGAALGWLAHGARAGSRLARAEATLAAARDNEHLLRGSLSAASEDSARRHSGAMHDQLSQLVTPLREAISALNEQVARVETNRTQAYAGLREQVAGMHRTSQHLSAQTGQLVSALRAPQVRGRWGEIQLERVVELAGMTKHCDFRTQYTRGRARPDLVVHLAGGKNIVVDAKVPFQAYLDAAQETEPAVRGEFLARHARQLRAHVDQLADKAYWEAFDPSPEFVVLFLPGDPFLDAALGTDPALLEHAFGKNVILATPTTLIALLRTVAFTWRQELLSRDAAAVQKLGRELFHRIDTAGTHLDRLGAQLAKAVDSFNHTVASMESRVMVTARKLNDLQDFGKEVTEPRSVDAWPRAVGLANGHANHTSVEIRKPGRHGHANEEFR